MLRRAPLQGIARRTMRCRASLSRVGISRLKRACKCRPPSNGISMLRFRSVINCPPGLSFEDFEELCRGAHAIGASGCAFFGLGCLDGSRRDGTQEKRGE